MCKRRDNSELRAVSNLDCSANPQPKLRVGFILARSFTMSAFAMFIDTLRLAADEFDRSRRLRADWEVLANTRQLVRSSCGVSVAPTNDLVSPERFDVIVVVGGLLSGEPSCNAETLEYLKKAAKLRVPLIGLCTGSFVLAEAGLLDSHHACVSWLHFDAFRYQFPHVKARADRLFNFDGRRGTCAGGSSAADLAAFLVRAHIGEAAAQNALEVLQIPKARGFADAQARMPLRQIPQGAVIDQRVNAVLLTMEQSMMESRTIEYLASSVAVSRRQLERLFRTVLRMSPAQAYHCLRLKKAYYLLVTTDRRMVDIATDVGFDNPSHFARSFRRAYGKSPSDIRATRTDDTKAVA